jgi:hypothetical protein
MGKDRYLPLIALLLLTIACLSSIYVYNTQASVTTISINGHHYSLNQVFLFTTPRAFSDLNYQGIALDDLIIKTGVSNPEKNQYTIIGSDGYQKTVTWTNMKNGLLTPEGITIFSDLPKAFRVKDVVSIEVK